MKIEESEVVFLFQVFYDMIDPVDTKFRGALISLNGQAFDLEVFFKSDSR
jgi:hypothetical protein